MRNIEIQEIPQPEIAEAKITEQLPSMDGQNRLYGFQFKGDAPFHEKVKPVGVFNEQVLVSDSDGDLFACIEPPLSEVVGKALLIRVLEQSGPKGGMYRDC